MTSVADHGGDGLNAAQRGAVEFAGGPLIVLAGPGTGKTRVIVHRVAHMIRDRGIAPERIVAATFTVKAAEELRARLAGLVGEASAQRVTACTLHALGMSIIRRHADVLGLPPPSRITLIDAAQRRRVLKDVIRDMGLFPYARGEGLGALCDRLAAMFDAMADRGVLPSAAVAFAEGMPIDDASRGEFLDTARAYGADCERRWGRGRLVFSDCVLLPLIGLSGAVPGSSHMRAMLRQDHGAFVVDEFQDCNPGQIEMIRALAGGENPDLCVVGDDDQAIYRFRGADERAFQRFHTAWPGAKVIALTENYRSVPEVVAVSNACIERAGASRFAPEKVINAVKQAGGAGAGVRVVCLDQEFEDAEVISASILAARAAGDNVPFSSFAVIARGHGDLERIAGALTLDGIPWSRRRESSVLDEEGVQDLLAWVEWLLDENATWCARRVLVRPPRCVDAMRVLEWERAYRSQAARLRLEGGGASAPFHEWLWGQLESAGPGNAGVETARAVLTLRRELSAAVFGTAVGGLAGDEALDLIVRRTGVAHAELLAGRERARRVSALVTFLRLAREKQRDLDQPGDLRSFWAYFTELRDADPKLESALRDGVDGAWGEEEEDTGADGLGRVALLTAHSAKGLEFDTVFVARVKPQHGFPQTSYRGEGVVLPAGLGSDGAEEDAKARRLEEERRLFYVACTRAERRLVLVGAHKGKRSSSTNYLDELLLDGPATLVSKTTGAQVLKEAAERGLGVLARTALEAAGLGFAHRRGAGERVAEDARQARMLAAGALERAGRADLTEEGLRESEAALARAARMMAITARGAGASPAWLTGGDKGLEKFAAGVAAAHAQPGATEGGKGFAPPDAPLSLSYTSVDQYTRCPCCWYLRFVLRLPGPESSEVRLGNAAHRALDEFVKAWSEADADGRPAPVMEDLLRLGRRALAQDAGRGAQVSEDDAAAVDAMLRTYMERLHDAGAHVVETERSIEFPYAVDGVVHRFQAKIDRVDEVTDSAGRAAVRVVDYKSGQAWKKLREPEADDLQLGIYAMALAYERGEAPVGTAEYWILPSGQRGVIALESLKLAKVRSTIDKAVRGILAGEFESMDNCGGACGLLRG